MFSTFTSPKSLNQDGGCTSMTGQCPRVWPGHRHSPQSRGLVLEVRALLPVGGTVVVRETRIDMLWFFADLLCILFVLIASWEYGWNSLQFFTLFHMCWKIKLFAENRSFSAELSNFCGKSKFYVLNFCEKSNFCSQNRSFAKSRTFAFSENWTKCGTQTCTHPPVYSWKIR